MPSLENLLQDLYRRRDSRISVLASFQTDPYTYVKVFVDDGTHGITVETITKYAYEPLWGSFEERTALKAAVHNALKKAADIITKSALAPVIKSLGGGSAYSGVCQEL